MPTWVDVHYWVVTAVREEVETVNGFGIEVRNVVGGNESASSGVVVTRVAVIQARFAVVVISTVADRVDMTNMRGIGNFVIVSVEYFVITPSVVNVSSNDGAVFNESNNVALRVTAIPYLRSASVPAFIDR